MIEAQHDPGPGPTEGPMASPAPPTRFTKVWNETGAALSTVQEVAA